MGTRGAARDHARIERRAGGGFQTRRRRLRRSIAACIDVAPGGWQRAKMDQIVEKTYRAKTFTFRLPEWRAFRPGQHVRVRLTAADGYQAQRSYSIASAPEQKGIIDLTIELVEGGEVSPYFQEVARLGDEIGLRGPIGGPFTWKSEIGGPLLLVAGGSGIVPLMSMPRHRRLARSDAQSVLLYSSRSFDDILYHAR